MYHVLLWAACITFLAGTVTCLPGLKPRQDSNIPSQCQSSCDLVVGPISTQSCTPQLCCTDAFVENLASCDECLGNLSGTTNYSTPQTTIDQLVMICADQGLSITEPTLPGQSAPSTTQASSNPPTSSQVTHTSGSNSAPSSSSQQNTVTSAFSLSALPSQITITSLPTTTSFVATSPSASSASTSAPANSNSGSSQSHARGNWIMIFGFMCTLWIIS